MGTGYTRNDTGNNIADGNVINASDLDGEFDAVQAAFNGSTGHSHDGTTGEGPQIDTAGIANDAVDSDKLDETDSYTVAGLTVTGNTTLGDAATDTVTFTADVASNILPNADGTLSIGASGSSWGDAYITTLYVGDTEVTSTAAELNVLDGITSTTAELNILDGVTSTSSELNLVDGSTAGTVVNSKAVIYGASGEVNATTLQVGGVAITATPAELNTLDGITATTAELNILDGVTSTTAELNILDGVTADATEINTLDGITATTAELNIMDGDTAATATTLVDADRVVTNDAGVMKQVAMSDVKTYMENNLNLEPFAAGTGGSTAFTTALGTPSVSGTVSVNGAPDAGTLAVSVSGNIAGHTLSINEIPSHSHGASLLSTSGNEPSNAFRGTSNNAGVQTTGNTSTNSAGGGGGHSHNHNLSGTLNGDPGIGNLAGSLSSATAAINVQYVDVIIATKD